MNHPTPIDDDELAGAIRRGFSRYGPQSAEGWPIVARNRSVPLGRLVGIPILGLAAILVGATLLAPASMFAGWTPVPASASPAIAADAMGACNWGPLPPDLTPAERAWEREMRALPMVVVDQRGRAAVALFARSHDEGQTFVLCLGSTNAAGIRIGGGAGAAEAAIEHPASGPLRLFTAQRNQIGDREPYTAYAGSVSSDVSKVVVERTRGVDVTATVDHGYFVAWWPGDAVATRIAAFDRKGGVAAEIETGRWMSQP